MSYLIPNNNIRDLDQTYLDYTSQGFYKPFGNVKKISESENSLLFSNEDGSLFVDGVIVKIQTTVAYSKYFYFKNINGSWKSDVSRSWFTELGVFPNNIIVGISNDYIDIFNYDNLSVGYWMRFTNATDNILNTIPLKVHFANAILTIFSENTFYWIDFSNENTYKSTTVDAKYNGTITQRNSASTYTNLSSGAFPNIASAAKFFQGCRNYGVLATASAGFRLNFSTKTVQKLVNQECFICSIDSSGNSIFKSSTNIVGTYERTAIFDTYCDSTINRDSATILEATNNEQRLAYLNFGKISTMATIGTNPKIRLTNTQGYWSSDRESFAVKTGMDFRYGTADPGGGAGMDIFEDWLHAAVSTLDMYGSPNYSGLHLDYALVEKINVVTRWVQGPWLGTYHLYGNYSCRYYTATELAQLRSQGITVYQCYGPSTVFHYDWEHNYYYPIPPNYYGYRQDVIDPISKRDYNKHEDFNLHDMIQTNWISAKRKVLILATEFGTYLSTNGYSLVDYYINMARQYGVTIIFIDPRNPGQFNGSAKAIAEGTGGAYFNNPTNAQLQQGIRALFGGTLTGGFVGVHEIKNDWQSSSSINVCTNKPAVELGDISKIKQVVQTGVDHTKDPGMEFSTGALTINSLSQYPITNGEVCRSTLGGTISVTDWDKIDNVWITDNVPVNTEIKYLISFNGGTNWKYFVTKSFNTTDYDYLNFTTTDSQIVIDDTPFLPSPPNPPFTPNPWFGYIHLKVTSGPIPELDSYEAISYHFVKMGTSWDAASFSTKILNGIEPFSMVKATIGSDPGSGTPIADNSPNVLYLVSFNDGAIYGYWDAVNRTWAGVGTTLETQDFVDNGMTLEQMKNIPKYAWKQYSQSPYKVRVAIAIKAFSNNQAPTFQGASVGYYSNTTGWLNISDLETNIATNGMTKATIEGLTWQDWSDYINQGTFDFAMNLKTTDILTTPDWTKVQIANNAELREFTATNPANVEIISNNRIKVQGDKISLLAENITTYDGQWLLFKTTNFLEMKAGDIAKEISIVQNMPVNTQIGFFFSFDDFVSYNYADFVDNKWVWNSFADDPKNHSSLMMTANELMQLTELAFDEIRDITTINSFDIAILLRTDDNTRVPVVSNINITYRELQYLGYYSYPFMGVGGWENNSFVVEIPITSGNETKFDKGIALYTPNGGIKLYSREAGGASAPKFVIDLPGNTNTVYFEADDFPTMTWTDTELTSIIKDVYLMEKSTYWIENNFLYRLNVENHVKTSASGLDNTTLYDLTTRPDISKIALCGNSSVEQTEKTLLYPTTLYKTYFVTFIGANIPVIFKKTAYLMADNSKLAWYDQNHNLLYSLNYNANGLINCDSLKVDKNVLICTHGTKLYFLNYESNEAFRVEDGIWEKYNGTTETLNSGLGWSFYYQNPNYGSFDWTGSTVYGFAIFRTTGYWYGICFSTDYIGFLTNFSQTQEVNWIGNRFFMDNENIFFDDGSSFYKSLNILGYKSIPIDTTAYNVSGTAVSTWKFGPQSATYNGTTSGNSTVYYFKFTTRSSIPITFRYYLTSSTNGTILINGNAYGSTTSGSWQNLVITPGHLVIGENTIQVTFASTQSNRSWDAKLLCTVTTNSVMRGSALTSTNAIQVSGTNYKIYINMLNCMNVYYDSSGIKRHITDPSSGIIGTDVYQIISGLNISDFWVTSDEILLIATEAAVNKILGYSLNDGTWNTAFDNTITNNNFSGIRK